jgi:hypothetical protein
MHERTVLQTAVGIAGLVPVGAGLGGVVLGTDLLGLSGDAFADGHVRYLSGLLLGIGLVFWGSIPTIERRSDRVAVLTVLVVIGGLARLGAAFAHGDSGRGTLLALTMELIVTPALCLWQRRIAGASG